MVTRGREFPNSKRAGRNASDPMSSLVNKLEKPTLWSEHTLTHNSFGVKNIVLIQQVVDWHIKSMFGWKF